MTIATASPMVDGLAILATLSPKIRNFCREYVLDYNGSQAAIRAGYSARTAASIASQHLTKIKVQQSVCALAKRQADRLDLTHERVTTEVARISFVDPRTFFTDEGRLKKPKEWSHWAGAVASYNGRKQEITFHPKVPALTLAARITKLIGSDETPALPPGSYMIMVPATSNQDQWLKLAEVQTQRPVKQLNSVNGTPSGTAHVHHNGNGNGD